MMANSSNEVVAGWISGDGAANSVYEMANSVGGISNFGGYPYCTQSSSFLAQIGYSIYPYALV